MDKYTVDLDKVLNDFEYSELTDNFGTSTRQYLSQGASNYASSSKSRTGEAKHSITNVFHSLNEYLSTDISTNPKQIKSDGSNKENLAQNYVETGNLLDLSFNDETEPIEETPEAQITSFTNADVIAAEPNLIQVDANSDGNEDSEREEWFELPPDQTTTTVDIKNEHSDKIETDSNEVKSEENRSGNPEGDIPTREAELDLNPTREAELDPNPIEDCEHKETETIEKLDTEDIKPKEEPVVKFGDTLDIDDSTLNKFLDDLEEELDVESKSEEIGEESVQDLERSNSDSIERPSVLSLNNDVEESRKIDLIGEPGSTPYNNLYVTRELSADDDPTKASSSTAAKDKENSVSPTFSEASTDTVSDSSDVDDSEDKDEAITATATTTPVEVKSEGEVVAEDEPENPRVGVEEVPVRADSETPEAGAEGGAGEEEAGAAGGVSGRSDAEPSSWLGRQAPLWIPDADAPSCLHCDARFTVIKRRHHCRACGLVLCSKCCSRRYRLEYLDAEARVCARCHDILSRGNGDSSSGGDASPTSENRPNPNNPMEYCSVVPPLQQVGPGAARNPPTVMVPVGVLKRKGSNKKSNKSVMFYDGIRPGSDLTRLDADFDAPMVGTKGKDMDAPRVYSDTKSFVPKDSTELPPLVAVNKSETTFFPSRFKNDESLVEMLKAEKLTFALQKNIFVHVKIVDLNCCINKKVWCFSTEGFLSIGQDEIVYLIEVTENESSLPIDIFNHLNIVYNNALKGTKITELGFSLHDNSNFLGFKNHAGFLYIRPTLQCIENIIKPNETYLIGLLIHRWEFPWAKVFPLRLMLRLGAEYRYYPSPLISTRFRNSLFVELGHTVITLFADLRQFSYTFTAVPGFTIRMEDRQTTVTIPSNRYEHVVAALNNSSDHALFFPGTFSAEVDSHLVCIQNTDSGSENAYSTHAITIENKPRKVTGLSFIIFNGALKSTSGLTAKSSIVEDGLMVQVLAEDMRALRDSLRAARDHAIRCGRAGPPAGDEETVSVTWGAADAAFNRGVASPIDGRPMAGVPSIRTHGERAAAASERTSSGSAKTIRWTEVFVLESSDGAATARARGDLVDVRRVAEEVAKAACAALGRYLDLLCGNSFFKIGIRTTLNVENVSYWAGSNNIKLPPIYMKSLDNELIPVLHRIASNSLGEETLTLELIFRILNS